MEKIKEIKFDGVIRDSGNATVITIPKKLVKAAEVKKGNNYRVQIKFIPLDELGNEIIAENGKSRIRTLDILCNY